MEQQLDISHATSAAQAWSAQNTHFDPDAPIVCASVWAHEEHQELQIRYTKTLEELAAARNEVIRLTVELSALRGTSTLNASRDSLIDARWSPSASGVPGGSHGHQRTPGLTENGDLAVGTPTPGPSHLGPPPPLMLPQQRAPREVTHPLASQPPDPNKIQKYRNEISDWVRPVYAPSQLSRITNYLSSQSQVTNLKSALVDVNGNPPTPSEWKAMCADRLHVVNDVLNTCRTWRQQEDDHRELAIAVMEKRWPSLCLCEPDQSWKASVFLTKRLDEVLKMKHKEERVKRQREEDD